MEWIWFRRNLKYLKRYYSLIIMMWHDALASWTNENEKILIIINTNDKSK